jgi:hypothetical protein
MSPNNTRADVIASRTLVIDGRPDLKVEVLLFRPESSGAYYQCRYQIVGIGDEKIRLAFGIDAFQALQLALRILPSHLALLKQEFPGLRWLDDDSTGDLGFD